MSPKKAKGAKKGKKPKNKDPRNKGATWCIKDLYWDENGCLYIKNPELAQQIYDAIWVTKHFCIVTDDPNFDPNDPEGGGGGNKINAMCPCSAHGRDERVLDSSRPCRRRTPWESPART